MDYHEEYTTGLCFFIPPLISVSSSTHSFPLSHFQVRGFSHITDKIENVINSAKVCHNVEQSDKSPAEKSVMYSCIGRFSFILSFFDCRDLRTNMHACTRLYGTHTHARAHTHTFLTDLKVQEQHLFKKCCYCCQKYDCHFCWFLHILCVCVCVVWFDHFCEPEGISFCLCIGICVSACVYLL